MDKKQEEILSLLKHHYVFKLIKTIHGYEEINDCFAGKNLSVFAYYLRFKKKLDFDNLDESQFSYWINNEKNYFNEKKFSPFCNILGEAIVFNNKNLIGLSKKNFDELISVCNINQLATDGAPILYFVCMSYLEDSCPLTDGQIKQIVDLSNKDLFYNYVNRSISNNKRVLEIFENKILPLANYRFEQNQITEGMGLLAGSVVGKKIKL